ncbi:hypothetical protein NLI96_g11422 [Meripilus lineatus]|uniref:Uncharacterized protein n=1 Tax=Meripilus lineatus TaxID=2056292 RepID=A0AAD5URT5_9APHY|nr:hypothetical protein NLI96_g11422 [Physisporinus lineatus]
MEECWNVFCTAFCGICCTGSGSGTSGGCCGPCCKRSLDDDDLEQAEAELYRQGKMRDQARKSQAFPPDGEGYTSEQPSRKDMVAAIRSDDDHEVGGEEQTQVQGQAQQPRTSRTSGGGGPRHSRSPSSPPK